ncbi:energy transducer TonB [Gilvimarinus agarilyticus]|uniref:energy transducer TonB family protein n=1 Tax=Gilvimarinus sp. 2_MG-2023 TaxID=3062666 RepID=UPI001C08DE34|nr:energy transducer TonB [Gilvimarinus sp. 2_MG-2023]MBU2884435.1 energy transducer TonB [Gilvimarinus agarilyticus]MDO6569571.1 energy transducer TonB [Gilvimarinus sp. 2_MG-2023]
MSSQAQVAVGIDTSVKSADRLSFTVFIAVIAHAMLIFGLSFTIPKPSDAAPTLEITLATHSTEIAPEDANFLAQHNQEASGTELANEQLTTDQQADFAAPTVNDINPMAQVQAADQTADQLTQVITTQGESSRNVQKHNDDISEQQEQAREGLPEEQPMITPEIASLQAKLDRQRQEYAKRPRVRRLTSVATKTAPEAAYLLEWGRKVEQVGNANYPQQALSQGITGKLRMTVTLNANGTIRDLELSESSGVSMLDQAALQIIRLAAPFDPIPASVREKFDQLQIIRTWSFEINGLSTAATSD